MGLDKLLVVFTTVFFIAVCNSLVYHKIKLEVQISIFKKWNGREGKGRETERREGGEERSKKGRGEETPEYCM